MADRTYMRGRGGPSPIAFGTSWTLRLIVLFVAGFVVMKGSWGWFHRDAAQLLSLSTGQIRAGRVWTVLTAALVHDDVWPLVFNGLAVWVFGKLVEETLGGARYLLFLVLAVIVTHAAFLAVEFATGRSSVTSGASGIVMAALVFAAFRYPGLPITLVVFPLKLWHVAALYAALVAYGVLQHPDGGGCWTPLAGAAYGLAAHRLEQAGGLRLPRFRSAAKPHHEPGPFRGGNERAEIDRLLDKISEKGIGALSDEERDFLKRNSGQYR